MIQILKDLPDNVLGVLVRGRVTNEECRKVLRPAIELSLKKYDNARLYYEIACRFPGAGWGDLELGLDQMPKWERIAIVTDTARVRQTVSALGLFMASVRAFTRTNRH
jgi:hypothetical protein